MNKPVKQEPVALQDIEQYRMQMAGISTAALGYWKEGDSIHPDYDTPALRDVAALYAKYAKLYAAPVDAKAIRANAISGVACRVKALFDERGYDPTLEEELVTAIRGLK